MQEPADIIQKKQELRKKLTLESAIAMLADHDGIVRNEAREYLVRMGKPAVPALIDALRSLSVHTRWESAKALSDIRDPRAAPALVDALEDEESAVRWLAARALIGLGRNALV